jgi:electron transfer flavoprotein alpha subunit
MHRDIELFIIAETEKGGITRETFELVSFARELARDRRPTLILAGNELQGQAEEIAAGTCCDIVLVTGESLGLFNVEAHGSAIFSILPKDRPSWVCLAHTSAGCELAPYLAVKLEASCITAVEGIRNGALRRSVCSGRFKTDIMPKRPSVVVTVLPGAFPVFSPDGLFRGSVRSCKTPAYPCRSRTTAIREAQRRDSVLKDAQVIVSAGRGVGKKENLSLIKDLAALFPQSAVGASRAVCDAGWLDYRHQIGTTGQTVSPQLYIACGISGAIQHTSGMKGSRLIVAINSDPHAAIFQVAHHCIVEDLVSFLPLLMDALRDNPPGH